MNADRDAILNEARRLESKFKAKADLSPEEFHEAIDEVIKVEDQKAAMDRRIFRELSLRHLESLIESTGNLSASDEIAKEKSGLLDDMQKLAAAVKIKGGLSISEFYATNTKVSELEDRKAALDVKLVRRSFGPMAAAPGAKQPDGNIFLTSDAARGGYDLPEVWTNRQILGKDFWFDICYYPSFWQKVGLEDEPFIKDSLMRIGSSPIIREYPYKITNFEYDFFDPQSVIYRALHETDRPFAVYGEIGPLDIAPSVCRRFLKEYGDRFAGFMADECFGNKARERCWMAMGLPYPRTRQEAFLGFTAAYFNSTINTNINMFYFRSWALTHLVFRPWTSCGTATYLDHWILELGAPYSGEELGASGIVCTPMQLAFSRGAARQYRKPWRTYLALYAAGVAGDSAMSYSGCLSPECRRGTKFGPYSGTSLSLQRRQLFAAYMSGVNMIRDEHDLEPYPGKNERLSTYVALYDWRHIDKTDPLVKVMRDKHYYLSPAGEIRKELYDNIVKKHDRGMAYTPVGLIFDRYHGFILNYARNRILGILPYTEGDYMMRAVNNSLFPWEDNVRSEGHTMVTSPYGDMFDVLTNNARLETLKTYRTLLLVGNVDLDKLFAQRLLDYVSEGGTLLINAAQISDGTLPEAFLGCKILNERGEGRIWYSLLDGEAAAERKSFGYRRLKPISATPLIIRADGDNKKDALATMNEYGKGRVILTAPDYLYEVGSRNRMLNMFGYLMGHLRDELLPVRWEGNVEVLVNRSSRGWVVTLINNEGVLKKGGQKEMIDDTKKADVRVTLNKAAGGPEVKKIAEWVKGEKLEMRKTGNEAEVKITVPPGDVRILEFRMN
ncbi:MAG: hypothetical protein PHP98_00920 [Kiritimatiellae bacterium]|nr:hypothetical protein [Kiritimatiellia bacterium]